MARYDLAFVNLVCATMLPDTAGLKIPACMETVSAWTKQVKTETHRLLKQFRRDPGQYNNSEAYFRALAMITVLQRDCGVRYDLEASKRRDFRNSREGFLHGVLTGDKAGTCSNLPVLYTAVGRRLGYPIRLVLAKGHLFCRWHDPRTGERFNLEASGRGLNVFPDDYYITWPRTILAGEVRDGTYLRSLDPVEELAVFMLTRGHCLEDRGYLLDAIVAYGHAHRLMPTDPHAMAHLLGALNKEIDGRNGGSIPNSYRQTELLGGDKLKLAKFVIAATYDRRINDTEDVVPNEAKGAVL